MAHPHIKNESQLPIIIVADTDRETHLIVPGGSAEFLKPNIGDNVTYHVWSVKNGNQKDNELYADEFVVIPGRTNLLWTGSKLEHGS